MPQARNTFGLTMPQPPHSTQPGPPFLFGNQMSTSADGSVNGKKCGRNRVRPCGPNSARANASRVPRRWAIVRLLVHGEPLDLVEHRGVGGVEFVGAEGAPDRDDVHRQFTLEQGADLHGRGVGAQHLPGALGRDVEGVLFAAGRVVRREVQRVEVELLGLDLGTLGQFPAHRDEGVGDVLGQDRDRVPGADRLPGRRQRHVDAFGDQDRRVPLGTQHRQPLVVRALDVGPDDVDPVACVGAVGLGQRPEGLARQRDRRPVAEVLGLGAGQLVQVGAWSKARLAALTARPALRRR